MSIFVVIFVCNRVCLLYAGASEGTPGDAKCVRETSGGGTKIRKLGTKFKFDQMILRKIINIAQDPTGELKALARPP